MRDWESLESKEIDEEKQSRRGKVGVYLVILFVIAVFVTGIVIAANSYGWIGIFFWIILAGIVAVIAGTNNYTKYR